MDCGCFMAALSSKARAGVQSSRRMTTRLAVILVAGMGSRLRPLTDDRPKALVDVGGETILGRAVRLLAEHGVERVLLATGYREDAVREAMRSAPVAVECFRNPRFDGTQNSVSLAMCRSGARGEAFFKLDGDVVFAPDVLSRLGAASRGLGVAVDRGRPLDAEAMKVRLDGTRITAFGKAIRVADAGGESIGIERVSARASEALFEALDAAGAQSRDQLYYEDVYSELIAEGAFDAEAVDVSDLSWTEVDDHDDLRRARALF
jgi:choline kinase